MHTYCFVPSQERKMKFKDLDKFFQSRLLKVQDKKTKPRGLTQPRNFDGEKIYMNLGNIVCKFKVGRKIKRAGRCEGFIEDKLSIEF